MHGIVGLFAVDGRPVPAADVERMKARSALPAVQPLASASDACLWFSGRLDNADPSISDAAAVLAAYEQFGDRFVARLNGDFALALIDRSHRRLTLSRDVMASQPLFYCELPGVVLFASEIRCLLAHSAVDAIPDEDGLAELVLDYWCDEHRTCFKHIYSVPPGQSIVIDAGGARRRTDWTFDQARQIRHRSFGEYRDEFRWLFRQAVRRRVRSTNGVAVAVSGGLDSSSIFCQALDSRADAAVNVRGISLTFPPGVPSDEQQFLVDIERMHGVSIERLPVTEYAYVGHSEATVRWLDTPGGVESNLMRVLETTRGSGCDVLLSGFFGDQVLSDRGYFVDLARHGRWLKIRQDLRELAAWMTDVEPRLFRAEIRARLVRGIPPRWLFRLVKRLFFERRGSARYPAWFADTFRQRAAALAATRFREARRFATAHTEQHYRHATAGHYRNVVRCETAVAAAHGVDLRYPFRDRDLVAFLMAIPGEIINWQGVPKGLLRHALTDLLPAAVRDRRWKADFTALENSAMRRDAPRVAALFDRGCCSVRAGFVDARALDHVARTFASMTDTEGALPGWRLSDLAGLELWLRML